MPRYNITAELTVDVDVELEAEDEAEAIEKFQDLYIVEYSNETIGVEGNDDLDIRLYSGGDLKIGTVNKR